METSRRAAEVGLGAAILMLLVCIAMIFTTSPQSNVATVLPSAPVHAAASK